MNVPGAPAQGRGGSWEFNNEVADVFEDMLVRSIPQYEVMRQTVTELAMAYRRPDSAIVDLGASRGDAIAPLVEAYGRDNHFLAVEISPAMLEVLRQRFPPDRVTILPMDLRHDYPDSQACVTLSILTLHFIPIEYRQSLVRHVYRQTTEGGAFIVVEKVLGDTAAIDDVMVARYYALKTENGYTDEEIARKRLALEGVLVPMTARWNEDLLRRAGFEEIDCFWRWHNFAGWLAVKRR